MKFFVLHWWDQSNSASNRLVSTLSTRDIFSIGIQCILEYIDGVINSLVSYFSRYDDADLQECRPEPRALSSRDSQVGIADNLFTAKYYETRWIHIM